MAGSPAFERTCAEIEASTSLDRLEARGTVRIALRGAGLDAASVEPREMQVVVRRVLPQELVKRGVPDAPALCERIAAAIADAGAAAVPDRLAAAARTMDRLGGGTQR